MRESPILQRRFEMELPTPEGFLNIESRDDVVIARFSTQVILGGQIAEAVSERLASLLRESDRRRVVVDFANVRSLTSLMLGKLVHLNNVAGSLKTKLVLYNIAPNVRKTLEVTRLDQLLSIKEDEASALE